MVRSTECLAPVISLYIGPIRDAGSVSSRNDAVGLDERRTMADSTATDRDAAAGVPTAAFCATCSDAAPWPGAVLEHAVRLTPSPAAASMIRILRYMSPFSAPLGEPASVRPNVDPSEGPQSLCSGNLAGDRGATACRVRPTAGVSLARRRPVPGRSRRHNRDCCWMHLTIFNGGGYRVGPAVTGGVRPMPPGAGLAIRLRTGPGRRRSSACAAARPGPPPGHRSRC